MKLDDFLKCKKVRCLSNDYDFNEQGKAYKLHGLRVFITDETGCTAFLPIEDFEPVLDSAEKPLQGMELTPEFEAVVPHVSEFKVGDPVYWGLKSRIFEVYRLMTANVLQVELDDCVVDVHKDELCPATQENYEKLCSLFERIDFEQPPKELKGSDLARALIKKGWVGFNCVCGNSGDDHVITYTIVTSVNNSGQFISIDGRLFNNAVPMLGSFPLKAEQVGL